MNNKLNTIIEQAIASGLKEAVKETALECGKKVMLGVGCEVAIHFISKKIIQTIEEHQEKEGKEA